MSITVDRMESTVDRPSPDSGVDAGRNAETDREELQRYSGEWIHAETRRSTGLGLTFQFIDQRGLPPQEAMDATMKEGRTHATRLNVSVGDSLLEMSGDAPGWSLTLPLDGGEHAMVQDSTGVEFSVSLTWWQGTPVVRRAFGAHGAIFDALEISDDGFLVVTRTGRVGMQDSMNSVQYVYSRREPIGPPSR